MKKLKKFYRDNRILVILFIIVVICVIAMGVVLLKYFYSGANTSKYGDRLNGIEEVEIVDSRISEEVQKLQTDEKINNVEMLVNGKTIYFYLTFNQVTEDKKTITLADAQTIAFKILDDFSEEEKKFYDFEFHLKQDKTDDIEGFNISGAKNSGGTNLLWNRNNPIKEETENKDK